MKDGEYIKVAREADIPAGSMRTVSIEKKKILILRTPNNDWFAIGGECPHAGAPLEEGLWCGNRLICPWHKSVFEVTTGKLLEPPSLDDLPKYAIKVRDKDVLVSIQPASPKASQKTASDVGSRKVFVIVGAGAAGTAAVAQLRQAGFPGRVILISREERPAYDRTLLSKEYLAGKADPGWLPLRPEDFYAKEHIERLTQQVESIDPVERKIFFDGKEAALTYDQLLLATGAEPQKLSVPGGDSALTLRTPEDADRIITAVKESARVVVIGSSFIGMEVASSLVQRKASVTVVTPETAPFSSTLGDSVGLIIQNLHEQNGVKFCFATKVQKIEKRQGRSYVLLQGGTGLEADLIVAGIGVQPVTSYLQGKSLGDRKGAGIRVDDHCRMSEGLYAAGDIATFPLPGTGEPVRIEHWRLAQEQGRVAALNMMGIPTVYRGVPYFWSTQFGHSFEYVGYASQWDEVVIEGDTEKPSFTAYYVKQGKLLAAFSAGRSQSAAAFLELARKGNLPSFDELRGALFDLESFIEK